MKSSPVKTPVVDYEYSRREFEIAWNKIEIVWKLFESYEIYWNHPNLCVTFETIETTHVIAWNQVLIEIIFILKQAGNGPSLSLLLEATSLANNGCGIVKIVHVMSYSKTFNYNLIRI